MGFHARSGPLGLRVRASLEARQGRSGTARWLALLMAVAIAPQLARAAAADCGDGPTISLSAVTLNNNQVLITGQVCDDFGPDNLTITLSGVVDCTVVTDADGCFVVGTSATAVGQIDATVQDRLGLSGGGGTVLSNPDPRIDFDVVADGNGQFTLQGRVWDTWAPGLEIIFSGFDDVTGYSVIVDDDGTFSLSLNLDPKDCGTITASTVNWWGQRAAQSDYVDASY